MFGWGEQTSERELDAQGNPVEETTWNPFAGGRRRRRRFTGGSFVPNNAHSSASNSAPFTGGRRRRTRRTKRGTKRRTRRYRR